MKVHCWPESKLLLVLMDRDGGKCICQINSCIPLLGDMLICSSNETTCKRTATTGIYHLGKLMIIYYHSPRSAFCTGQIGKLKGYGGNHHSASKSLMMAIPAVPPGMHIASGLLFS